MIVTTKELFKAAYGKYAIGAYNINNLEQTMVCFAVALTALPPSSSRSAKAPALTLTKS
jgi:fructose-bisphosphate aldolase class II